MADKHPAVVLAREALRARGEGWHDDADAQLRRIPVLEGQRNAANECANGLHAMLSAEAEKVKALEAERDRLSASEAALLEALEMAQRYVRHEGTESECEAVADLIASTKEARNG